MKIFLVIAWTAVWVFLSLCLFMPTISVTASSGIYFNVMIYFGILAVILKKDYWENSPNTMRSVCLVVTGIAFIFWLAIYIVGTWSLWHASKYQAILGNVKETQFTSNISPVDPSQMLVVDKEIAKRIGEKELGSIPGLGSRAELGEFNLQPVAGKLYWIAPLEHSGLFKWLRFDDEGTPGYVKVSATNQEDYGLITKIDGKDIKIKYQTKGYFGEDLERHIYTNGYQSTLFQDFIFEVDDNWNPYWSVTLYDSRVGFDGDDAIGVLTINPATGEIKEYSVENSPLWVDRIQPEEFLSDQVDDWGRYVHGWWNWSKRDVKRVVSESSLVLGSDGRSYFYFGITSDGNDNSTVGFMMVDTKNKEAHWFKQSGATEPAAKSSAEGKVQEKQYVGSEGITYNIGGYPTYEFLLKDKAGLMKLIALVNVHDHSIVGIGESRHEAVQDYRSQLTNRGNSSVASESDMEKLILTSKVKRFASQVTRGNTSYYFILEDSSTFMFNVGTTISDEIPLTKEGDLVSVQYLISNSGEVILFKFDNKFIGIEKKASKLESEKNIDSVRINKIEKMSEGVVDAKWNDLSAEEKQKLLKK